jgi:hypothetical protein
MKKIILVLLCLVAAYNQSLFAAMKSNDVKMTDFSGPGKRTIKFVFNEEDKAADAAATKIKEAFEEIKFCKKIGDFKDAFAKLRQLAIDYPQPDTYIPLATMYYNGEGCEENEPRACILWLMALIDMDDKEEREVLCQAIIKVIKKNWLQEKTGTKSTSYMSMFN